MRNSRISTLYHGPIRRKERLVGISEASQITDVPIYTLRYWEKEFSDFLIPARTIGNQRKYSPAMLTMVFNIKRLLKDECFSIQGAKKQLARDFSQQILKV
jgi:DNA-binding transcriptional MerR regulator